MKTTGIVKELQALGLKVELLKFKEEVAPAERVSIEAGEVEKVELQSRVEIEGDPAELIPITDKIAELDSPVIEETDEEVIGGIIAFCKERGIAGAHFSVIGACKELTLAYYDLAEKRYLDHEILEDSEIVSVTGNIGLLNSDIVIHAHGVFGKRNLETVGGHIKKLVVSATGEVALTAFSGAITRAYDPSTGLNLIS